MSKTLLIDLGSTSIKFAIFDKENKIKSTVSSFPFPNPLSNPSPLFEVNAEDIVQPILKMIESVSPVDRIYISTQMHGYLLGTRDGKLLTPYISWQDQRSTLHMNGHRLLDQFPVRLPPISGSTIRPNSPTCSLFAMSHIDPELFSQATEFYTLGSYLAYHLTGVNATHITDAAASGMYNKEDGSPQFNIYPFLRTPQATLKVEPVGHWGQTAVYSPVGDQQASVRGSGLQHEHQYLLNLGTAAQLCVVSDAYQFGDFESRPYFEGKTLCTVSGLLGGKEIATQTHSLKFVQLLADDYFTAMGKLPARKEILVIGGVSIHHRELIADVCDSLQIPCRIRPDTDALDGLISLLLEEITT
ncbi:FGGY family carbohydrate kinase [Paenibacillus thalictri]|uniref:FGGY family carbohydrate kinase n=1 Tax=Paenibacillus thalictri TaxID=2527873 RepID=UPI0013EF04E0|nr:FGGY family carbohydrate kinase [Paenibacillus thalictri]